MSELAASSTDLPKRGLFVVLAALSLTPFANAPAALVAGLAFALVVGNPLAALAKKWTTPLLQLSVIALGASMDLRVVARAGVQGLGYTVAGIAFALGLGALLARLLRTDRTTALLVSVGTAICGGSAIAAVAPVVRAKSHQTSVALGVVFLLNAAALFVFPRVGHAVGLSPEAFGLWSALAIHDTSSVVGAALAFGPEALGVATTVKLARALWIVPLTILAARFFVEKEEGAADVKPKRPWFIAGFLAAAALATWVPALHAPGLALAGAAKHALVLTLFLIGSTISRDALRQVGVRPLALGVVLWVVVAAVSLGAIAGGWVGVRV